MAASPLNVIQNACIDFVGPHLASRLEESLTSQYSGMIDMTKESVNFAVFVGSTSDIAKTEGAIQNIEIATQFLNTSLNSLKTVQGMLNRAAKDLMTLRNGTVSDANKLAAADSIIDTMGMVAAPESRAQQEGGVVTTLRQSGTGQCPFYNLTTTEGAAPSAYAVPPQAVSASSDSGASTEVLKLEGSGASIVPPNTFASADKVTFTNLTEADVGGEVDPATATVLDPGAVSSAGVIIGTEGAAFQVALNGTNYTSDYVVWDPASGSNVNAGLEINMYQDGDRSKYVTFFLADTIDGLVDSSGGEVQTAFQALWTGSVTSGDATEEAAVEFVHSDPATFASDQPDTFDVAGITVSGVTPGAASVAEATYGTGDGSAADGKLSVKIGDAIYANDAITFDGITPSQPGSITLYLNGDTSSSSTMTVPLVENGGSYGTAITDDATLYAAFAAAMNGEVQESPPPADVGTQTYTNNASGGGTYFTAPLELANFSGVEAGTVSVGPGSNFGVTADGTDAVIEVLVGDARYLPDASAGGTVDIAAATGTSPAMLWLNGDAQSGSSISVPFSTAGSPPTNDTELVADLQTAIGGELASSSSGSGTVPFAFNAGSNFGAGYFTMSYDGTHLHFTDQFGDLMTSYPIAEADIVAAGQGSGQLRVGNIGTLNVAADYSGGTFTANLITTPTDAFNTSVAVSFTGGSVNLSIPNLTDLETLWGTNTVTLDAIRLTSDTTFQAEVAGMVDHALEMVKQTMQDISSTIGVFDQYLSSQQATMESLHDLQKTVSAADPIKVANDVFTRTQQYLNMILTLQITASVLAEVSNSAQQIAMLATR